MKFPSPCWEGLSRLLSAVLTGEGSARWSASLPGVPRHGGNFMSGSQGARGQRGLRRLILSAGCCIRGRHDTGCLLVLLPLPHAPRRHLREVHSPGRAVRAGSSPPSRTSPGGVCSRRHCRGTHETADARGPARQAAGVNASLLRWSR